MRNAFSWQGMPYNTSVTMRIVLYLLLVSTVVRANTTVLSADTSVTSNSTLSGGFTYSSTTALSGTTPEGTIVTAEQGCSTNKVCRKRKGTCMSNDSLCEGRVGNKGCGSNCICCIKEPETCKEKGTCRLAGGYCVIGNGTCTGSIIPDGCTGKDCVCCANDNNCPYGFYRLGTECFQLYEKFATWDEARQICNENGWELAEPENLPALATYIDNNVSRTPIWIGGRGIGSNFMYLSGHTIRGSIPWDLSQPGSKGTDHCLILMSSYPSNTTKLASYDCFGRYYFLCEPVCPEGFFRYGSGCYKIEWTSQNWDTAERSCYDQGLQLAELANPKGLAKWLYDRYGYRGSSHRFWLGARGGRIDGNTIAWNSGEPVPIPHPVADTWYTNRPTHKSHSYCLQLSLYDHYHYHYSRKPLYEEPCGSSLHSLCEWKCPVGFFHIGNRCYKAYYNSKSSWTKAHAICVQAGGKLAEPENPIALGNFLVTVTGHRNYWLGGRGDGNRLRWTSGEAIPSNWAQWHTGYPGSKVGMNYCLRLAPEFRFTPLKSTSCSRPLYPLCQRHMKT